MNIEDKKRQVDISWSRNDQKSYELEIENIETQEIVFKESTDRNLKPVQLPKGLYRWRVTTIGQKIRGHQLSGVNLKSIMRLTHLKAKNLD